MQAYIELPHGTIITTDNPKVYDGPFLSGKRLSQKDGKLGLKIQALANLLGLGLKAGDTVYSVLRHVSASGMSRHIDFYIIKNDQPIYITGSVASLLGLKRAKNGEGLIVTGCGMDMGFATVYSLGLALWPHGTPEPHGIRNGEPDSDGGYALKHRWL
ncbi:hypothetical protein UFOVP237_37 [uncultured Caudovirales phage]|uniref:Uncharacterized protein n=1 Tax=uncultured Caudovirales phage TaxID=2100421 RepID=A0A6J7WPW2_9CAUD|nr:hypothetical protein UFOVP237_37 [uncultured Caudovirales phage]